MRAFAVFGGLLLTTAVASAQSTEVLLYLKNNSDGIVRGPSHDADFQFLNQFNRQNCLDDETVEFNVDIRGSQAMVGHTHLEAWVGSACDERANRISTSSLCTQVAAAGEAVETLNLRVRDLVRSNATSDADPCASDSELPTDSTLYFVLVDADGEPPPASTSTPSIHWAFKYDLVAPPAPTMLQASPIAGGLHLTWEHPDAPIDMRRYVFLCDPPPDADPDEGYGPNELCVSAWLGVGEELTTSDTYEFLCGYAEAGATSTDIPSLSAEVTYAVAVLALDSYGNIGPLSDTTCEVPKPPATPARTVVTDRGCAIGGSEDGGLAPLLMAVAVGEMARRRRRLRRSASSRPSTPPLADHLALDGARG